MCLTILLAGFRHQPAGWSKASPKQRLWLAEETHRPNMTWQWWSSCWQSELPLKLTNLSGNHGCFISNAPQARLTGWRNQWRNLNIIIILIDDMNNNWKSIYTQPRPTQHVWGPASPVTALDGRSRALKTKLPGYARFKGFAPYGLSWAVCLDNDTMGLAGLLFKI